MNLMGMYEQCLMTLNGGEGLTSPRYKSHCWPYWLDPNNSESDEKQIMRHILMEAAEEAAFEAVRWFDLVRISSRPGYETWLPDIVSQKYPANQQARVYAKLSDKRLWYLPYYYKNVAKNPKLEQKAGYK